MVVGGRRDCARGREVIVEYEPLPTIFRSRKRRGRPLSQRTAFYPGGEVDPVLRFRPLQGVLLGEQNPFYLKRRSCRNAARRERLVRRTATSLRVHKSFAQCSRCEHSVVGTVPVGRRFGGKETQGPRARSRLTAAPKPGRNVGSVLTRSGMCSPATEPSRPLPVGLIRRIAARGKDRAFSNGGLVVDLPRGDRSRDFHLENGYYSASGIPRSGREKTNLASNKASRFRRSEGMC